jgi:sulfite reductase alpha subunit-like flavoprotein
MGDGVKDRLREYTFVILVISTTGQGDLPANSLVFWRSLLRRRLSASYLAGVQFTTFGLGDSSYPKSVPPLRRMCFAHHAVVLY